MPDPITASATTRHASVSVTVSPSFSPLNLGPYEDELEAAAQTTHRHLRAAKLVHDTNLLRAALYAQATGNNLLDALAAVEVPGSDARYIADKMLDSTLRMAGWRTDTPEPKPRKVYKTSKTFGLSSPVNIGMERSGDVLVNLDSGMTIVATATGADIYHWEHPWREGLRPARGEIWEWAKVDPDDIDPTGRWWWTGNYLANISRYDSSRDRHHARETLTTPDLPVDIHGITDHL